MEFSLMEKDLTDTMTRLLLMGSISKQSQSILVSLYNPRVFVLVCLQVFNGLYSLLMVTGKTYRLRVSNVGISTSLNFRIQGHNLVLAESEGSYTVQQNYTSLDIHVGQSYSFLVTMDQNASSDYYIVASARVVNETIWRRVTGVGILKYTNSKGKAKGQLPPGPQDEFDKTFSMNQARSIRLVIRKSEFFFLVVSSSFDL